MKKIKLTTYAKLNDVTPRTVWNWIKKGLVKYERTETNRILIIQDEEYNPIKPPRVAVYARVSSAENKENLERQKDRLVSYANAKGYKVEKIITEIGSGLNDQRPKLEKLLTDKTIDIIIVEHKDRLARFGVNYIEKLLALDDRRIEVVNPQTNEKDDLMQDFVSIITSFCARLYGKRRTKRQTEKIIEELNKEEEQQ